MGGRCPYSCCFVECCLQDLFNIVCSILVWLQSSFFSIHLYSIHAVYLYSSTDMTATWKKLRFILSVRSDFHMTNAGHFWRSRDKLISDVLLWTPSHGQTKAGRPARAYIQQLCADTGCSPKDLLKAMEDREGCQERVRDIHADSTTWWWWWLVCSKTFITHINTLIYIYIYIYVCVCWYIFWFESFIISALVKYNLFMYYLTMITFQSIVYSQLF